MKFLLPALLIGASTAHADIERSIIPPHFLLLHPGATVEIDAGGGCTRLTNHSEGLLYVPLTNHPLADLDNAFSDVLEVNDCVHP